MGVNDRSPPNRAVRALAASGPKETFGYDEDRNVSFPKADIDSLRSISIHRAKNLFSVFLQTELFPHPTKIVFFDCVVTMPRAVVL